jgi:hypothetical protein
MRKLILLLAGLFITLLSFAQPSFYRAYRRSFGTITADNSVEWQEGESCRTLFSVEGDRMVVYAKETTTIYITGNLTQDEERALIYEGVDDDGGDCTLFFSKTDDGHSFVVIRYSVGAIMFLFETEQ